MSEYGYSDINLGFVDSDGTAFEKFFPHAATDFEIDYFLKQLLPYASYKEFDNGSVLFGIGEYGITYRDKHTSIGDFFPESEVIRAWLNIAGLTRTRESCKTLCAT